MTRQSEWNKIWNKKYNQYKDHKNLHVSAGFDSLTYLEWVKLTSFFITKLNITPNDDILDVGCGSGAFLAEIKQADSLSGIDYSKDAINKIKTILDGDFHVSEASKIPFDDDSFDLLICFSVFFYFNSLEYASDVIHEMLRVLKPGGKLFIGEINDLAKKEVALQVRADSEEKRDQHRVSKSNANHLYYPINYFEQIAKTYNLHLEIIKQDVPELSFYFNASYRFSVIFTHKGKK